MGRKRKQRRDRRRQIAATPAARREPPALEELPEYRAHMKAWRAAGCPRPFDHELDQLEGAVPAPSDTSPR